VSAPQPASAAHPESSLMRLPDSLEQAIERECASFSHAALRSASQRLSSRYQERGSSLPSFQDAAMRAAYLAVRMPATYAAVHAALLQCSSRMNSAPHSLLDLGAGPGTAAWAAADIFPSLTSVTLVEQSQPMVEVGQKLATAAEAQFLRNAIWRCQSLQEELPLADLALLSYCAAELTEMQLTALLQRLWKSVETLVIVEPGTPDGYQRILYIRDWALAEGAHLIAPCPHRSACPMQQPDWCHFPARVERTRMHKFLKSATLGYEDEKFSYLAIGKTVAKIPEGRIVGPVKKGSGHVQFPLCTRGVLQSRSVSRKQEEYRLARKSEWGDSWM